MVRTTLPLSVLLFVLALTGGSSGGERRGSLMRVEIEGQEIEGTPLAWSDSGVAFLTREGTILGFEPKHVTKQHKTTAAFESYSTTAMRSRLTREFGEKFEVTAAGKYLVVHPRGHGQQWARRFDELYRSFRHYFSVRGFDLEEPEFPLVAVVLRTRGEYEQYRQKDGVPVGTVGYYSPGNNRVVLYDVTEGTGDKAWHKNAATIIHEATHQTAFNVGIHNRLRPTPRWVAEGLGTMFEAEGVWDSRNHTRQGERINKALLAQFKKNLPRRKDDSLAQLVASDRAFKADQANAYAEAWALTFFLVETRPRDYAKYLKLTVGEEFQPYPDSRRLADFMKVFGKNFKQLDAQFVRFIEGLK
ncbi:MAG: DUF1570 domain-containing protein [Planctomycetia bacterium]|nr:DUF1570 domain-containing protein [Planctomycetia bacterium]